MNDKDYSSAWYFLYKYLKMYEDEDFRKKVNDTFLMEDDAFAMVMGKEEIERLSLLLNDLMYKYNNKLEIVDDIYTILEGLIELIYLPKLQTKARNGKLFNRVCKYRDSLNTRSEYICEVLDKLSSIIKYHDDLREVNCFLRQYANKDDELKTYQDDGLDNVIPIGFGKKDKH